MVEPPTGTVTFLLTDVVGSTRLWEQDPPGMWLALQRHDRLIEDLVDRYGGVVVRPRGEGDSRFAVFSRASDAVAAAHHIQGSFVAEQWPIRGGLHIRMALHTGDAELSRGDYYGSSVNRCARLRTIAHGDQTLLSAATAHLVRQQLPRQASLKNLGIHHLRDLSEPEEVFELVHPELRLEFPALDSLLRSNNLPRELNSFIGREQELTETRRLLATTPLLTLCGPGGVGKTRLALRLAAEVEAEYADGVRLVELALIANGASVPTAVATALSVREEPGRPLTSTLVDATRARRLLLVLDNCEHVVDGCAELASSLLAASHGVRILATSREPLRITGEVSWPVPTLAAPDRRHQLDTTALARFPAIRLFEERARAVMSSFVLTPQNSPAVAAICAQLDGLPLAIELAAARARVLSPDQIIERLDDALVLLVGGSRVAPTRQQTLRATLDWSFDLLAPEEQQLFQRLGVLAGAFDLAAAEATCILEGGRRSELLDMLSALVDRSLVVIQEHRGSHWYRLLEPVRQYAFARLSATEEYAEIQVRHARHFLALAELGEQQLRGPDQEAWYDRLEIAHADLRMALDCWYRGACNTAAAESSRSAQLEFGLRIASALWSFWWVRGHTSEGDERLSTLLRLASADISSGVMARALFAAGWMEMVRGRYEAAARLLERSQAIARAIGDQHQLAFALTGLGNLARYQGEHIVARTQHEASLTIRRNLGDPYDVAMSLGDVGVAAYLQGDYASARLCHEESLAISRKLRDRRGIGRCLGNLASVAVAQHDFEHARALSTESLAIWRELGDRWAFASSLERFAGLAAATGQPARALRLAGAAAALREASGTPLAPTGQAELASWLEPARSALGHEAAAAALTEGRNLPLAKALEYAIVL
jgi:predicted ATPase/class 3 adenylate cyclase